MLPRANRALVALLDSDDADIRSKATSLVYAYVFGKPVERSEVSGPGGGPIESQVTREEPNDLEMARQAFFMLATVLDSATASEGTKDWARRCLRALADKECAAPAPAAPPPAPLAIERNRGSVPESGSKAESPTVEPASDDGPHLPTSVNGYRLEREHKYAGAWWSVIDPLTGLRRTRASTYETAARTARDLPAPKLY
jgi:hypothetical protein